MLKFGTKTTRTSKNGITRTQIERYHDERRTTNEVVYEERIPIIRITDANTIFEDMQLKHALTDYGVWVEKNPTSGKLYVVKCWIEHEDE